MLCLACRLNDYFAAFQDAYGEIDEAEGQISDNAEQEVSFDDSDVPGTDATTGSEYCATTNVVPKESFPSSQSEYSGPADEEPLDYPESSFISGFIVLIPLVLGVGKVSWLLASHH